MKIAKVMTPVVLAVIGVVWCFSAARAEDGRSQLTVKETLGAVFIGEVRENSEALTALASANPKAKPKLYKLLKKESISKYHRNIFAMLGYIGNKEDVTKLQKWLKKALRNDLTAAEYDGIRGLFGALGEMSSRGVTPARDFLSRLCYAKFWKDRVDKPLPKNAGGTTLRQRVQDPFLFYALREYARSGADDWQDRIKNYLASIEKKERKKYISSYLNIDYMQKHIKKVNQRAFPPISKKLRHYLGKWFNGDLENPARAEVNLQKKTDKDSARSGHPDQSLSGSKSGLTGVEVDNPETAPAVTLIQDALANYKKIKALIQQGDLETVSERLMDDGEPLEEESPQESPDFKQVIALEKEIFDSLDNANTKSVDFQIKRNVEYEFNSLNKQDQPQNLRKAEEVRVSFKIKGSKQAAKKVIEATGGGRPSRTLGADDNLIVVMKKIDGDWYWNPFGW